MKPEQEQPKEQPRRELVIQSIRKTGFALGLSITLFFLTFYLASYVYMGVGGTLGVSLGQTAFASLLLGVSLAGTILSGVITYNRYIEMMNVIELLLDDYDALREQVEKEAGSGEEEQ